jgi:flagellar operon protein
MSEPLTILPRPLSPLGTTEQISRTKAAKTADGFERTLARLMENPVGFSRHAMDRMASRGISFSDSDLQRLNGAVDLVQAKGGRESLVLMDNTALVVSVKNRQVITVMDQAQLKDNVFTNIDSAIIA